jgi:hypothetical protein
MTAPAALDAGDALFAIVDERGRLVEISWCD